MEKLLDNYCSVINGGTWSEDEYVDEGIPVLRVSNMVGGTVVSKDDKFLSESSRETYAKHELAERDILIATVGSHPTQQGSVVGRTVRVPKAWSSAYLNQNAACLRINDADEVDPNFFWHLTNTVLFKHHIESRARGSANQVRMGIGELKKFDFDFPTIEIQRKIAAILTAYDDLIETNKRRIALLEKMAEELYREWFVRMRFPGHESTKFVKGVPEGWEVRPMGSICSEVRTSINKKDLADDDIYIGLEHIPRKSIAFKDWATADSVDSNKLLFNERDILFSKIRPYLHKVALAHFSGACSSDTIVLRPPDRIYEGFLLFTVFSDTFIELATIAAKGTKMPRADWAFLEKLEIKIPPPNLAKTYQSRFEEIFSQISALLRTNNLAIKTRDLLLPRLISGKLSVEDLDIQFPPSMQDSAENAKTSP